MLKDPNNLRSRRIILGVGLQDFAAGVGVEAGELAALENGWALAQTRAKAREVLKAIERLESLSIDQRARQVRDAQAGRRFA